MTRIAKRPTSIRDGMCEHGCCDWCPQGCFDPRPETDTYEQFQRKLKQREYCVGWHPVDSQKKRYYHVLFDSWHEAENIARSMRADTGYVFFIVPANVTKKCDKCNGTGLDDIHTACAYCNGKGRVRA